MTCSQCGAEMNRHAEKPVYDGGPEGLLEEIHACPGCGNLESRPGTLAGSNRGTQDT